MWIISIVLVMLRLEFFSVIVARRGDVECDRAASQLDSLTPSAEIDGLTVYLTWPGICQQGRCWHRTGAEVDGGDLGRRRHRKHSAWVTVFGRSQGQELKKSGPCQQQGFHCRALTTYSRHRGVRVDGRAFSWNPTFWNRPGSLLEF